MREIKFRAWDKKNKELHSLITWHDKRYLDSVEYATGQSSGDVHSLRQDKNCIIMQFTGLKDKNGKEIYEGDICERPYYESSGKFKFIVKIEDLRKFTKFLSVLSVVEVIGNIHKNPELLKGD